jgi:hypothetical protein
LSANFKYINDNNWNVISAVLGSQNSKCNTDNFLAARSYCTTPMDASVATQCLVLDEPSAKVPVVVAIELGCTFTGIGYSYPALGNKTFSRCAKKVPTVVLVNDNGKVEFGLTAELKYAECLEIHTPGAELPGQLFRGFILASKQTSTDHGTPTAVSVAGKKHCLMDLLAKYLTALKTFAGGVVSRGYGWKLSTLNEVQWVIAVHANWNNFDKEFLRRAAYKAGLASTDLSNLLMVVQEAEAAALTEHVRVPECRILSEGNHFVVLNCTHNATEIFSYKVGSVQPLKLKSLSKPGGGTWGLHTVNAELLKFLKEFLGPASVPDFEGSLELKAAFSDFARIVEGFDPFKEPATLRLVDFLPEKGSLVPLAEAWNDKYPERPVLFLSTARNGFLSMSKELVLGLMEPLLREIVDEIRCVIRDSGGIRHVLMVGEFANNAALTARIMAEFHNKQGVHVVLPDAKPDSVVMQGVVYFGYFQDVLKPGLAWLQSPL